MVQRIGPYLLLVFLLLVPAAAQAREVAEPAEDVDLSSPRATLLETFFPAMNGLEEGEEAPEELWPRVYATMQPPERHPRYADEARIFARRLVEVFDKLGTVEAELLPDAEEVAERGLRRFEYFPGRDQALAETHAWVWDALGEAGKWPEGRIVLAADEQGRWRFTRESLMSSGDLLESMSPLPPRHVRAEPAAMPGVEDMLGWLGPTFGQTTWLGWGGLLLAIFLGLFAGKLVSGTMRKAAEKLRGRTRPRLLQAMAMEDAANPASVALLTLGLAIGLTTFVHLEEQMVEFVLNIITFLYLVALGWLLFNLVNLVEVGLERVIEDRAGKLGDMLVPLIRKTLRVFLVVIFALVVAQNVFGLNVTSWLAGLGIAGLAVSLAAQDSIRNVFGSLTVLLDKPFAVGDWIIFDGSLGGVEEIGFRSTKIRLLTGNLLTVPNMRFIDSNVENLTARPSIRREMDITITYDTPKEKIERAVQVVREVLTDDATVEDGMFDMENSPPRVAFNDFNADSLNIKAFYWYRVPPGSDRGYFTFLDHAQAVNLKLFERFSAEGIDFAFPTQTLYLAGDPDRQLSVNLRNDGQSPGFGTGHARE